MARRFLDHYIRQQKTVGKPLIISSHDIVPFLGQLICYSLIIERKQPTYSGGKSHVSCVMYIDFPICSVVRTYENELNNGGGRRGRRRW